jgi:hypothetical protein
VQRMWEHHVEDYEAALEDTDLEGIWTPPESGPSSPVWLRMTRYSTLESDRGQHYGNGTEDDTGPPGFCNAVDGSEKGGSSRAKLLQRIKEYKVFWPSSCL